MDLHLSYKVQLGAVSDIETRFSIVKMWKLKRAFCWAFHRRWWEPTCGLGWTGKHCTKCGYSFFGEWEDWAK